MKTNKIRISKLLSGRLWLTIICGLSFLAFVITICQIMYVKRDSMSSSELTSILNVILVIISNVMTFYFTKNRDDTNSDLKKEVLSIIKNKNESESEQDIEDKE